jgi:hypothetical protein
MPVELPGPIPVLFYEKERYSVKKSPLQLFELFKSLPRGQTGCRFVHGGGEKVFCIPAALATVTDALTGEAAPSHLPLRYLRV